MEKVASKFSQAASRAWASAICAVLVTASNVAVAQSSFTDRVQNAKARDSSAMLAQVKTGTDNWQMIISLIFMLIGFAIMAWGVFWVMAAARSEGRKEAKPGWFMIAGGGVLGAATGIYLAVVGIASSAAG